ncbi:hypothetical protein HDV02_006772 [Globomyces sp. JEL0801]|nr:hypothetical protein HDV02_006772 [Globomyces sp. JEL0801]
MTSRQDELDEKPIEVIPLPTTDGRLIVIAIDHSEHADTTIQFALDGFINPNTDKVMLLNVRPSLQNHLYLELGYHHTPHISPENIQKLVQYEGKRSVELLNKKAALFLEKNIKIGAYSLVGDARYALEEKINELHPSCVLVGSRGLGVIQSTILGSVSKYLLHHLNYPVTLVPPKPKSN